METGTGDASDTAMAATLAEQLTKGQVSNPSLIKKLGDFLLDESPDPVPITEETHPVFYHATKNDQMYHFVPKKGVGIQKDGTKLHCFDYEASFHNRSKDFYDEDIQAAIKAKNIHRLSNLLVAAFTDLVLDGNSDMTSYMYLMDMATHALSEPVKRVIGDLANDGGVALALVTELVATASNSAKLSKRAVLSREEMDDLDGLEGANESYVRMVYTEIKPMIQTEGVLVNNGIDISQGWGKDLAQRAPSIDKLVNMDFAEFNSIVKPSVEGGANDLADLKAPTGDQLVAHQMYAGLIGSPSSNMHVPSIRGYALENDLSPQVAHELEKLGHEDLAETEDKDIYAAAHTVLTNLTNGRDQSEADPSTQTGDVGSGQQQPSSPVKNDSKPSEDSESPSDDKKKPEVDSELPSDGKKKPEVDSESPSDGKKKPEVDSESPSDGKKKPEVDSESPSDGKKKPEVDSGSPSDGKKRTEPKTVKEKTKAYEEKIALKKKEADRDNYLKRKMMNVRQDSLVDKAKGTVPRKRWQSAKGKVVNAKRTIGKVAAKSAIKAAATGTATAAAGAGVAGAGGLAGAAGSLASAAAGPLAVALALAPIIKDLAGETDRQMNENMASAIAEREKIADEVSGLLESVKSANNTDNNLADAQEKAQTLLDKVRNPAALALSEAQGMNLQKQLNALGTNFGPTSMDSLVPYTSDAELVAAVDSGRALAAVALFVDPDMVISTPERKLLQTPKYVSMMGASQPFETNVKRSTSETEAKSFVSSASHSGFSTAEKVVNTNSNSTQKNKNYVFGGNKENTSTSTITEKGKEFTLTDDVERNNEKTKKGTQAFVTEFTVMPMKSFCLREGGLALSPYAFYRIQRIFDDKDENGDYIEDPVARDATRRYKAREFIRNFGSHIPFGVQTLGGIFIRTMVIKTETAKSLSTLYATAAARLTSNNSEATKTVNTNTRGGGFLGAGSSTTTSTGHSNARMSGVTEDNSNTVGGGVGTTSTQSTFESDVICFGPNAATQDNMYQQLMSNNATWTIIDRGEPESYFALWDLVDYIGQGNMLKDECRLLREVWEEMALANSATADNGENTNALLDIVMKNYGIKQKMFTFVQALIFCLVPTKGNLFDAELANNFKTVVMAGCKAASVGAVFDLTTFVTRGVAIVQQTQMETETSKGASEDMDIDIEEEETPPVKRQRTEKSDVIVTATVDPQVSSFEMKFVLEPENEGYKLATQILNTTTNVEWNNNFSYFSDTFTAAIIAKGKPSYLYDVCRICVNAADKKNWNLVDKLISPDLSEVPHAMEAMYMIKREKYLSHKDPITGNYCLHLIIESNNLELVQKVHEACPHVASIKNKDNKSPIDLIAAAEDENKYSNLKNYSFLPKPVFVGMFPVWAIDDSNNVHYLNDKDEAKWKLVGDIKLKYIAVSNGGAEVWGVGLNGDVHHLLRNISSEWKTITCRKPMESIAVSPSGAEVWAIDKFGIVYKFSSNKKTCEKYGSTKLKSISIADGTSSHIYGISREDGNCLVTSGEDGEWVSYGQDVGGFEQVSVSPNGSLLWVTDWDGQVWTYSLGTWSLVDPAGMKIGHFAVDNGGKLWCIDQESDNAWYRSRHGQSWQDMNIQSEEPSSFKQIAVCDTRVTSEGLLIPPRGHHIWLVDTDNKLHHLSHESAYEAHQVPLPNGSNSITSIASNSHGHVWVVDDREKLFYRHCNSSDWQYLHVKNVSKVAAGANGGLVWTSSTPLQSSTPSLLYGDTFHIQTNSKLFLSGGRGFNSKNVNPTDLTLNDEKTGWRTAYRWTILKSSTISTLDLHNGETVRYGDEVFLKNRRAGTMLRKNPESAGNSMITDCSTEILPNSSTLQDSFKWIIRSSIDDADEQNLLPVSTDRVVYFQNKASQEWFVLGDSLELKSADSGVSRDQFKFMLRMRRPGTGTTEDFIGLGDAISYLHYKNADSEEIITNHLEVDGIQSLAISDNEEYIGYCKTNGGQVSWNNTSDSIGFRTPGYSLNGGALSLTDDGNYMGTHLDTIKMSNHSLESNDDKIIGSNNWVGSHGASMSATGEHIWAIKTNGRLYYKANKDTVSWQETNLIDADLAMVSVS